jgi:hypothetical protein
MVDQEFVKKAIGNFKYHKGKRGTFESYWQDCANFALPRKAWVSTIKKEAQELNLNFLYDSRATLAVMKSSAGFHSNLTNPSTRWWQSGTVEDKYMQSGRAQKYFRECDDIQYDVMNASNFNRSMMEFYPNILVFGVSTLLTEASAKKKVRYTSIPVESAVLVEDDEGYVNETYRPFRFTAVQCMERWKDNLPASIKTALKDGDYYKEFDLLHYVAPRYMRDVAKMDNSNMEYFSVWIGIDDEFLFEESGFVEDPYSTARWWKDTMDGSPYAYSPVMNVLGSIKLANAQKRTLIRVSMKQSDPAYASPYKFWIAPLNLNPAAMNYYDASKFKLEQFSQMKNEGNIPITVDVMKLEQDLIDAGLFVNLFENLLNVTKQMTIPEVQQRLAEALNLISPYIGHILDEGITPNLFRTRSVLDRQLMFPPAPKELKNLDMSIVYLSPLAKAQRSAEMNGLNAWTTYITGLIEGGFSDAKYILNIDKIGRSSADLLGVNPDNVAEQSDMDKRRQADQQMQQQMMQLKIAEEKSKIGKNLAGAHKDVSEGQAAMKQ